MATPQVVATDEVTALFAGTELLPYLAVFGTGATRDAKITKEIIRAQAEIERKTGTFLTHRIIKGRPADSGLVKGEDYDLEDDGYDFFRDDWHQGFVEMQLRRRPVQSIQRVCIRYGQSVPQLVLTYPEQWTVAKKRAGIVHILPLTSVGAVAATALVVMPLLGAGITNRGYIPSIVCVDYTAGYLPADFDPDVDDPFDANPDQDVRGLLDAVKYQACYRLMLLMKIKMANEGGSISVDGFSESLQSDRLDPTMQAFEKHIAEIIAEYNADDEPEMSSI